MDKNVTRRTFINLTSSGLCGISLAGMSVAADNWSDFPFMKEQLSTENATNLIGPYGAWKAKSLKKELPAL